MTPPDWTGDRVYRAAPGSLGAIIVLMVLFGALAVVGMIGASTGGGSDAAVIAAAFAAFVAGMWRCGLYPTITETADGLIVRNPLTTRHLPWSQIAGVSPGYAGLIIICLDGSTVTAICVQQSNLSTWTNAPTRAKRIAAEILELAAARSGVA